jgi:5-(carboxyamino)imidazole ribonucleotide synthase
VAEFRVGILGGGQLARMSILAAHRLGISTLSLDEDSDSPAAQVGPYAVGSIHNATDIANLMRRCEVVTFENEFIRADTLRQACQLADFPESQVIPGIETLEVIQDKFLQRQAYTRNGAPTPKAVEASEAPTALGFPCVLKARYGGYDGKGTRYAKMEEEFEALAPTWSPGGWLAEEFVPFRRELAVMVVSTRQGNYFTFPAMVTEQQNHVCDLVYPCEIVETCHRAEAVAIQAVQSVGGVGLFGVELFELPNGDISINEIAPRPHNTGHYTQDWGGTSQFEAHILTVIGDLGGIHTGQPTCMANILGQEGCHEYATGITKLSRLHPEARMHWYGKRAVKPGRKMGHLNVTGVAHIREQAIIAREAFFEGWKQA